MPDDVLLGPNRRRSDLSIAVWKKSSYVFHYIGYTIVEKNGKRVDILDKELKVLEAGEIYDDFGVPYDQLIDLLNAEQVDFIIVKFVEGDVSLKSNN